MEQFRQRGKTLIAKKNKVRNEKDKVQGFLSSTGLDQPPKNLSYGSALEVLKTIFEAHGQKHLVQLIQFRRIWEKEIGGFLVRHAMPSRITVEERFQVGHDYIEMIQRGKIDEDLQDSLKILSTHQYRNWQAFRSDLTRKLRRKLSQEELKLLRSHVNFVPVYAVLHLTVYDGSIAQAIQLEEEAYIESFNSKFPEFKLGAIRCKVGDLGHSGKDKMDFDELCSNWDKLSPMDIFGLCRPDRIHRVNDGHAVLILCCKHPKVMKRLQLNPGGSWMLRRIKALFPDIGETVQGLALICDHEDKEAKNIHEIDLKFVPPPRVRDHPNFSSYSSSDEVLSKKDQLKKIIKKLRDKKNLDKNS